MGLLLHRKMRSKKILGRRWAAILCTLKGGGWGWGLGRSSRRRNGHGLLLENEAGTTQNTETGDVINASQESMGLGETDQIS
jgi:hypothetical protein